MSNWILPSVPPHDWFLCLDIGAYFDHEHDPETIFEEGFTRPVHIGDEETVVTLFFNGDPDQPEFHVECRESLSKEQIELANSQLKRILGTELDIRPLYEKAGNDPVLGPKLNEFYGLKRMSRADVFEDAVNRIVKSNISHKPTALKMVYGVRKAYGVQLETGNGLISSWPRPHELAKADPSVLRNYQLSHRKGEYIVGLAHEFLSGELTMNSLEAMPSDQFYKRIQKVRGIGPSIAQNLLIFRNRTDCIFPGNKKKGQEKGLRRWIIYSYGGDPDNITEEEFLEMTENWRGFEAAAIEFLHLNWLIKEKAKKRNR